MKVHHIGYLVEDIAQAKRQFEALGFQVISAETLDEVRGINIVFLEKDGYVAELICPARADSTVSKMLKKKGSGPYHFCYTCENIDEQIQKLEGEGYMLISPPMPAPAFGGARVAFLFEKNIGIMEIYEVKE